MNRTIPDRVAEGTEDKIEKRFSSSTTIFPENEWTGMEQILRRSPFQLKYFESIDSTNSEARRDAEKGAAGGTVYLAGRQTQGRGQENRIWHSDDSGGVYCSVLFRPSWPIMESLHFVQFSALAVYDALLEFIRNRRLPALPLTIKIPNDIYLSEKKIAGILVETASLGESTRYAIVGMGINVNQEHFPADVAGTATSLHKAYGLFFDKSTLLTSILNHLWSNYLFVDQHGSSSLLARWTSLTGEKE